MSHKPSACIPPPNDYTSRPRPGKFRERGRGGGGDHRRRFHSNHRDEQQHQQQHLTFQKDEPEPKTQPKFIPKPQVGNKFYCHEDDDYFARIQDDENEGDNSEANAKTKDGNNDDAQNNEETDEDDPLEAYMRSLEGGSKVAGKDSNDYDDGKQELANIKHDNDDDDDEVKLLKSPDEEKPTCSRGTAHEHHEPERKAIRLDIDAVDDIEESYYQYVEQKKGGGGHSGDSDEFDERQNLVEYDKDGNIVSVAKMKREIEPLPAVDHSSIDYEPFQKSFYKEHDEIQKLTPQQEDELRSKLEIKVSGSSPPKPVCSFAHFKFDERLMKVIRRSEYTQPTPIQAQAIPAALLGRNIIGIAMTGSGKTAAYLWPMITHIMGQPDLKRGDGPIGLVLVPTRELALQVYSEAKKFSNSYKIDVVCAYGGGSKYEQSRDLEAGAEIVVATPGRLIDLIKLNATNLRRITYLVLDEADRFFEMGFELQVRSICDQIRPDRQTLLFSATFKHRIEQLARTVTEDPVKIVQKSLGEANVDVTQHVAILADMSKKWDWLIGRLVEFLSAGSVLIFVTRIVNSEDLCKKFKDHGREVLLLHGDMEQSQRNRVITSFKRKEIDILIATDVAARGLDIAHIRTVINFDVARDIDTHIHRVGRTGRAGCKGDAYTLLTDSDKEFAGHLVKNLESSSQLVGDDLKKLASRSSVFRKKSRKSHEVYRGSSSSAPISTGSHHHHHHHHSKRYSHDRDRPPQGSNYHNRHDLHGSDRGYRREPQSHHRDTGDRHEHASSQSTTSGSSKTFDDNPHKRLRWQ